MRLVDAFTQESVELSGRNTKFFCQESVEIINTLQLSAITLNAHAPYSFMLTNEFVPFQAAGRITEEKLIAIVPEIVTFVCRYRESTFRTLPPAGPMA